MAQPPPTYGQPVIMAAPLPFFKELPVTLACPQCKATVTTSTTYVNGLLTWLLVGVICVFGGFCLCLCLIPFCVDACKDVDHTCPNCQRLVGKYQRIG